MWETWEHWTYTSTKYNNANVWYKLGIHLYVKWIMPAWLPDCLTAWLLFLSRQTVLEERSRFYLGCTMHIYNDITSNICNNIPMKHINILFCGTSMCLVWLKMLTRNWNERRNICVHCLHSISILRRCWTNGSHFYTIFCCYSCVVALELFVIVRSSFSMREMKASPLITQLI